MPAQLINVRSQQLNACSCRWHNGRPTYISSIKNIVCMIYDLASTPCSMRENAKSVPCAVFSSRLNSDYVDSMFFSASLTIQQFKAPSRISVWRAQLPSSMIRATFFWFLATTLKAFRALESRDSSARKAFKYT
jgi:hypothetical protein